jgi:hypothetical protein
LYTSFVPITYIIAACLITIVTAGVKRAEDLPDFLKKGFVARHAVENAGLIDIYR